MIASCKKFKNRKGAFQKKTVKHRKSIINLMPLLISGCADDEYKFQEFVPSILNSFRKIIIHYERHAQVRIRHEYKSGETVDKHAGFF